MQPKPHQPKNLNAQLVEALGQRIIDGHYKEGEQLPVEADLCAEFGVSRSIMREATKILSAKGLLASRPRIGTLVRQRQHWNLLDTQVLAWITKTMKPKAYLDMMFEARLAIEPRASAIAAEKATREDIRRIRQAYNDMADATTLDESIEPDIRFHQAIMDATHNDIIRYMGHTLHSTLAVSIQLTSWHQDIHYASLPRHEAIYLAIADRKPQQALEATRDLLMASRQDFDARKSDRKKTTATKKKK
ncbi:MAG: FadR/GntR family transcriptional regulator [Pseudohongiellaceae bacterium]